MGEDQMMRGRGKRIPRGDGALRGLVGRVHALALAHPPEAPRDRAPHTVCPKTQCMRPQAGNPMTEETTKAGTGNREMVTRRGVEQGTTGMAIDGTVPATDEDVLGVDETMLTVMLTTSPLAAHMLTHTAHLTTPIMITMNHGTVTIITIIVLVLLITSAPVILSTTTVTAHLTTISDAILLPIV